MMRSRTDGPVFIVGCDRSGTTLLRLMVVHGPDVHIPQETNFLVTLAERAEEYGDFTEPRQRWFFVRDLQTNAATRATKTFPAFGLTVEEAEAAIASVAPVTFAGAASALYRASATKAGRPRWGDKTPKYVMAIPQLADAFPDAQFVHIIRDGRDVALSIVRNQWAPSIRDAARFWKERVEVGRAGGRLLPSSRYREVLYEDLVRNPERILRDLCGWLAIRFTPDMLRYYEDAATMVPPQHAHLFWMNTRPVDTSRTKLWTRDLSREDLADFHDVAGSLLLELGYECRPFRMPVLRRRLAHAAAGVRRISRSARRRVTGVFAAAR